MRSLCSTRRAVPATDMGPPSPCPPARAWGHRRAPQWPLAVSRTRVCWDRDQEVPHPGGLCGPKQGHRDGTGSVGASLGAGDSRGTRRAGLPLAPGLYRIPLIPCPVVTFAMD